MVWRLFIYIKFTIHDECSKFARGGHERIYLLTCLLSLFRSIFLSHNALRYSNLSSVGVVALNYVGSNIILSFKMPIIVKDYTWTQTEEMMYITVPLKGVVQKKVDVLSTENYVKINFSP